MAHPARARRRVRAVSTLRSPEEAGELGYSHHPLLREEREVGIWDSSWPEKLGFRKAGSWEPYGIGVSRSESGI